MTYPPYGDQPDPTRTFNQSPQQYGPPVVSGPPSYGQAHVYGQPTGYPNYEQPPAPKRSRGLLWASIALAVAVLFTGSGFAYAYNKGLVVKDSGIKACEALRDGGTKFDGATQNQTPMTEQQYKDLRKVFADSRYDDIRSHGTKLMDIVWQVSQMTSGADDSAGMAVLAYVGPLTTEMTGLQSACADQGIIVNLKPGN